MLNPNLDPEETNLTNTDRDIERVLRPRNFGDFTGQENIIENLKILWRLPGREEKP